MRVYAITTRVVRGREEAEEEAMGRRAYPGRKRTRPPTVVPANNVFLSTSASFIADAFRSNAERDRYDTHTHKRIILNDRTSGLCCYYYFSRQTHTVRRVCRLQSSDCRCRVRFARKNIKRKKPRKSAREILPRGSRLL